MSSWRRTGEDSGSSDEPMGQNPPDGAAIDYWLPSDAQNVTPEIVDDGGKVVRKYSSDDKSEPPRDIGNWPWWWQRRAKVLSREGGGHRFVWDLHYTPLPQRRPSFPIAAIPHDTAPEPTSPWAMPGTYTVKLTVDGKSLTQPLVVKMDLRVKTPQEGLARQFALSMQVHEDMKRVGGSLEQIRSLGESARSTKAGELAGEEGEVPRRRAANAPDTLRSVSAQLSQLLEALQAADVAPTAQLAAAVADRHKTAEALMKRFEELRLK